MPNFRRQLRLSYEPSHYQNAIFEFIQKGQGSAIIEAVAGSGKTTSIVACAGLLRKEALYSSFSRAITGELDARLKHLRNVFVRSTYSVGFEAVRDASGGSTLNKGKYWSFLKERLGIRKYEVLKPLMRLFTLARLNLMDFGSPNYRSKIVALAKHHSLIYSAGSHDFASIILKLAEWGHDNWDVVDYPDMVWLTGSQKLAVREFPWVFIDECQDLNRAQHYIARASLATGGRAIFVGDPCQPPGTMVATPAGDVPIEKLRKGDLVVSCDMASSAFIQKGKRVKGITKRRYSGDMIVVRVGDRVSRYTPNHRCVVRFSGLRGKWCVYLQRRGDQFRVGKCSMDYGASSGPVARARSERADALWILRVFETKLEAWETEQIFSGKFGIPQLRFEDTTYNTEKYGAILDRMWEGIGANETRAEELLRSVGQVLQYPLFDFTKSEQKRDHALTGRDGRQYSLKRPIVIRAANLIDGVELLMYENRSKTQYTVKQWCRAEVSRETYKGFVYSMDVDKYELYVADGLLTHNCQAVFGFAGSDYQSFQNIVDNVDNHLPLSVCYRCATSIIERAQMYCPNIEAAPGAPEGSVDEVSYDDFFEQVAEGDMVLCRVNAPLVRTCFALIRRGISSTVLGSEIGEALADIVYMVQYKTRSFDQLFDGLERWREQEEARIRTTNEDEDAVKEAVTSLNDQVECVKVIYDCSDVGSFDELRETIKALFNDKRSSVVFSSVHKAKGLEAGTVFILEPKRLFEAEAKQAWMLQQEHNLAYVAVTRAKTRLVLVRE